MIAAALILAAAPPPKIEIPVAPRRDEVYGDWSVSSFGGGVSIASVTNSAGSVFGVMCSDDECNAFFNPKIICDDGHEYPALLNAPGGAYNLKLVCEKIDDIHVYSLPVKGAIAEAMSVGGVLGIALPMASGQFQVARFSLTGSARATARASQMSAGVRPPEKQRAADNQTL